MNDDNIDDVEEAKSFTIKTPDFAIEKIINIRMIDGKKMALVKWSGVRNETLIPYSHLNRYYIYNKKPLKDMTLDENTELIKCKKKKKSYIKRSKSKHIHKKSKRFVMHKR